MSKTVETVNGIKFEIDPEAKKFTISGNLPNNIAEAPMSASGKSRVIASTHGNIEVGGIKWGINAYKRV